MHGRYFADGTQAEHRGCDGTGTEHDWTHVDLCTQATYSRGMGRHTPRTAADDLRDAQNALVKAQRALHDLQSHLDRITTNPDDAAGIVRAATRNASIVRSELEQVGAGLRGVKATVDPEQDDDEQAQLRSVS